MRWERLAVLRAPVLTLVGLICLCVAAFLWAVAAGWAACGVALVFLAYVTDGPAESAQEASR